MGTPYDHDSLRCGIARALRETGHEVDEAANGNAAIELLHKGQFDVVLSDLKMGGSDGLDVLRTAKVLHPTSAVILMTGFGSINTAVEAIEDRGVRLRAEAVRDRGNGAADSGGPQSSAFAA